MEELVELVGVLTRAEKFFVKRYLEAANSGQYSRRLELFTFIEKEKEVTDEMALAMFYESKDPTAFVHLKARLKQDIYNALLTLMVEKVDGATAVYYCRRLLTIATLLHQRNAQLNVQKVLKEIITIATQYELATEVIGALEMARTMDTARKNIKVFDKFSYQSQSWIHVLQKQTDAKTLFYKISIPNVQQKNKEYLHQKNVLNHLERLDTLSRSDSKSNIADYYILSARVNGHLIRQEFDLAFFYAKELVSLLETPTFKHSSMLSSGYLVAANASIECKQFESCIAHCSNALFYANPKGVSFLSALELLFAAQLIQDPKEARNVSIQVEKQPRLKSDVFIRSKWLYYRACLLFREENFPEALRIVRDQTALFNDRTGWQLGLRLVHILILIEMDNLEMVEIRLQGYRQHLKRHKEPNTIRYRAILNLLTNLKKWNFDYKKTVVQHIEVLKELIEGRGPFYRDPVAFEMIPFDWWLLKKAAMTENDVWAFEQSKPIKSRR